MNQTSSFALALRGLQERTRMSDGQLAEAAGVDRTNVWRWLNTGSKPKYDPVLRLAEYIALDRPDLAGEAAALLPAAGYGIPSGFASREEPAGSAAPAVSHDVRVHLVDALDAANAGDTDAIAAGITAGTFQPKGVLEQAVMGTTNSTAWKARRIALLRAQDEAEQARHRDARLPRMSNKTIKFLHLCKRRVNAGRPDI